jgi:hypothetical protein
VDTNTFSEDDIIKEYYHIEPRISARYLLNESTSVKASFNYNSQNIHLATTSSVSIPADVWLPSTLHIKPQRGAQYSVGIYKIFSKYGLYGSVELYYKNLQNQIELMNGILNNLKDNIFEESIVFGKGESKGIEFFIRKNGDKLNGWISYTLSKTTRQFDTINNGLIYPAKYDRRHDLSLTASYKLSEKWSVSGIFIYATGSAFTIPSGKYLISMYVIEQIEKTNSFRMPAYHRLDASITYNIKKTEKFESSLNLSVLNVYNRPNPFFIYFQIDGNIQDGITVKPKQVVLLPVMPSLTWNFRF